MAPLASVQRYISAVAGVASATHSRLRARVLGMGSHPVNWSVKGPADGNGGAGAQGLYPKMQAGSGAPLTVQQLDPVVNRHFRLALQVQLATNVGRYNPHRVIHR